MYTQSLLLLALFLGFILFGRAGAAIGARKNRELGGYLLGTFLGPVGVVLIAVVKPKAVRCPRCGKLLEPAASGCPKCEALSTRPAVIEITKRTARITLAPSLTSDAPRLPRFAGATATQPLRSSSLGHDARATAQLAHPTERLPVLPTLQEIEPMVQVARNGTDLGQVKLADVRAWLYSGELTLADYYFDFGTGQWVTLDCHPELSFSS